MYIELHTDHFILIRQIHATYTHGSTPGTADIAFMETNTLPVFRYQEDITVSVCQLHLDQLILVLEVDRSKSGFTDIPEIVERGLFHDTALRCHKEESAVLVFFHRDQRRNGLLWLELQEVHNRKSSGSPAGFGDLIGFDPVYASEIRKEQEIPMGNRHEQLIDVVIIDGLHSFDPVSATVLCPEMI